MNNGTGRTLQKLTQSSPRPRHVEIRLRLQERQGLSARHVNSYVKFTSETLITPLARCSKLALSCGTIFLKIEMRLLNDICTIFYRDTAKRISLIRTNVIIHYTLIATFIRDE